MQRIIGRRRKLVGRPNTRRLANCSGSGEAGVAWTVLPLVSEQMPAQFLQCALTQKIGIALAGLGKF
jgi:hypothetical protein